MSSILPHAKRVVQSRRTPIFANGCLVGTVVDTEFQQTRHIRHLLNKPPAIAFDRSALAAAEDAGAIYVRIRIAETRDEFTVDVATIHAYGFPVHRGHGNQVALGLNYWSRNGHQPCNIPKQGSDNSTPAPSAPQLSLFQEQSQ
jgi:hypothetical protein